MNNTIYVDIEYKDNILFIKTKEDTVQIELSEKDLLNKTRNDYALWFFLPIAMRLNMNLHINATGTENSIQIFLVQQTKVKSWRYFNRKLNIN